MNAKRILATLIIGAVTATMCVAQSNDGRTKWERLAQHKNQVARSRSVETPGLSSKDQSLDDSAIAVSRDESVEVAAADVPKGRIEGTWIVTQSGSDFSETAFYTFGAGRDFNEGVVAFSDQFLFVPNPSCLPGQGVWKRTAERNFIGTHESVCYDADKGFIPAGFLKFRYSMTLSDSGTTLTGTAHLEAFDLDGNLVFTTDLSLRGVRMQAQAP